MDYYNCRSSFEPCITWLCHPQLYFKQNELRVQRDNIKLLALKETEVKECLQKVEKDYLRKYDLVPTKDYPDARRWHNDAVGKVVEEKYNNDRDFCLKLNK